MSDLTDAVKRKIARTPGKDMVRQAMVWLTDESEDFTKSVCLENVPMELGLEISRVTVRCAFTSGKTLSELMTDLDIDPLFACRGESQGNPQTNHI